MAEILFALTVLGSLIGMCAGRQHHATASPATGL